MHLWFRVLFNSRSAGSVLMFFFKNLSNFYTSSWPVALAHVCGLCGVSFFPSSFWPWAISSRCGRPQRRGLILCWVQMHHHRAEHWIEVSGTASVTLDGQVRLLTENPSIDLPVGAVHALKNPGKILLELIEVQVGSYLGEDGIVRLQDRYGRV